jgi:TonB-dependent starch-binding outer membrane protein SusC
LDVLHPSNIEDITVLKDASATALYGMRGAAGVIVIRSKRGSTPDLQITYDGSYGFSFLSRKPDFLSPSDFRKVVAQYAPQLTPGLGTASTDWVKEVTRLAQNTQHTIALSQHKGNTRVYGSLTYFLNQGVLRFTQHEKVNFFVALEQTLLNNTLVVRLNTKNTANRHQLGHNVLATAAGFDPTQPVRLPNGDYFEWSNAFAPGNPVAEQEQTDNNSQAARTFSSLSAQYYFPFAKALSVGADYSYDYSQGEGTYISTPESRYGMFNGGTFSSLDRNSTGSLLQFFTQYEKVFSRHQLRVRASISEQVYEEMGESLSGTQLEKRDGTYVPTANVFSNAFTNEHAISSITGSLSYRYDDRYLFNGSIRTDRSSAFNSAGIFPAVSIGWQIHNERFAARWSEKVNELKLRIGYGVAGGTAFPFLGLGSASSDMTWSTSSSVNIGVDGVFFNRKLVASADVYERNESDFITNAFLPSGSNPIGARLFRNDGRVDYRGLELTLTSPVIESQSFSWNISTNFSVNKNKMTDLPGNRPFAYTGSLSGDVGQTIQVLQEGYPLFAFYAYNHKRNSDGSLVLDANGDRVQTSIEMYEDINKDGVINEQDLVVSQNPTPSVLIGISSFFTFKKWDASITLTGAFGHAVYNNIASANGYWGRLTDGGFTNNLHRSVIETDTKTRILLSDYYVQKASFVRVPNLVIGYTFNDFSFGRVRAYLQSQNVLTLSSYKGSDPEIWNGIDNNWYPRATTIMAGVSVTFR